MTEIIDKLPENLKDGQSVGDLKEDMLEDLLAAYKMSIVEKSTSTSIIADISRMWACRSSDGVGRMDVEKAIDIVYVKENQYRQSVPIVKILDKISFQCSEKMSFDGQQTPF